jgi:hypothetical protein
MKYGFVASTMSTDTKILLTIALQNKIMKLFLEKRQVIVALFLLSLFCSNFAF